MGVQFFLNRRVAIYVDKSNKRHFSNLNKHLRAILLQMRIITTGSRCYCSGLRAVICRVRLYALHAAGSFKRILGEYKLGIHSSSSLFNWKTKSTKSKQALKEGKRIYIAS